MRSSRLQQDAGRVTAAPSVRISGCTLGRTSLLLMLTAALFGSNGAHGAVQEVLENNDGTITVLTSGGQQLTQAEICATDTSRTEYLQ